MAAITAVLAERGIGLLELTQTVVSGYFTITLAVTIPDGGPTGQRLVEELCTTLGAGAAVTMVPFRADEQQSIPSERYILTASGEPGASVIHELTALVADRGGNFVDFSFQSTGAGVSFVAEIDLPASQALDQLQIDLQHAGASSGLQVRLQHQRLFTATNEIAFRRVGA